MKKIDEVSNFVSRIKATKDSQFRGNVFRFGKYALIIKISREKDFWGVNKDYLDKLRKRQEPCAIVLLRNNQGGKFMWGDEFEKWAIGRRVGENGDYKVHPGDSNHEFQNVNEFHALFSSSKNESARSALFGSGHGARPSVEFYLLPTEESRNSIFFEGVTHEVLVNRYERNPRARKACIEHYGLDCAVCEFSFSVAYGRLGKGFIHVHHLRDLATIGAEYEVDPIRDLRPVCPNCHAMLHVESPAMTIEKLKAIVNSQRDKEKRRA